MDYYGGVGFVWISDIEIAVMNTVIIGLGETGFSCVRYYAARNIPVIVMDSRENPPKLAQFKKNYPHIPVYMGVFPKEILAKAKTLVLSPGISQNDPNIKDSLLSTAEVIGDIEVLARAMGSDPMVVAITGSNGKSTVTTLVGEMAKAAGLRVGVGGNLGTPVLELLNEKPDLYVLELSSFQLETTYSLKPKAATVLNLSPDHLDRYASVAEYQAAKHRIFNNAECIIYNREDPQLPKVMGSEPIIVSFGTDVPHENQYGLIKNKEALWLARGKELLLPASKLKISGRHNLANALAAFALGESIGLPMTSMLSVLESFPGLPHRAEWVSDYLGVPWINDSKGTNVGATLATLQGLADTISGKWVLIAGGIGKNADFSPLVPIIQQHCKAVILIGEAAEALYTLLHDIVDCIYAIDMTDAVQKAADCVEPGDGVLLSPICASFDMFKNFEDRGNAFKAILSSLGQKG